MKRMTAVIDCAALAELPGVPVAVPAACPVAVAPRVACPSADTFVAVEALADAEADALHGPASAPVPHVPLTDCPGGLAPPPELHPGDGG